MRILPSTILMAALLAGSGSASATPVFSLIPAAGAVSGHGDETVGWGIDIQNDGLGYLVISGVTFLPSPDFGWFTDFLTPQFAPYTDGSGSDVFPQITPVGTWNQPFDSANSGGLGSYLIDSTLGAPGVDVAVGEILVYYDIHSLDLNSPGYSVDDDTVVSGVVHLPASVSFLADEPASVPEPASVVMALTGLALCGAAAKARRRRTQ